MHTQIAKFRCGDYCTSYCSTRTIVQEPMCLAHRKISFSKSPWSLTINLNFASFMSYQSFFSSHLFSLTAQRWSVTEKPIFPVTAPIRSYIARSKLVYLSASDVTGFYRPILYLFTVNILIVPTTGGRVFNFPKKRQGKNVSCRTFSTPTNSCPVFFVTH